MATINTPATGHGNKIEHYAGGLSIQYDIFHNTTAADKTPLIKRR